MRQSIAISFVLLGIIASSVAFLFLVRQTVVDVSHLSATLTDAVSSSTSRYTKFPLRNLTVFPAALLENGEVIEGEAPGVWYFEGSFPLFVYDSAGARVGQGVARAQSDWTVNTLVPFLATITISSSSSATGTLIFLKDNPSGLTQFDQHVSIPVRF